jgi:hypothetical protein
MNLGIANEIIRQEAVERAMARTQKAREQRRVLAEKRQAARGTASVAGLAESRRKRRSNY